MYSHGLMTGQFSTSTGLTVLLVGPLLVGPLTGKHPWLFPDALCVVFSCATIRFLSLCRPRLASALPAWLLDSGGRRSVVFMVSFNLQVLCVSLYESRCSWSASCCCCFFCELFSLNLVKKFSSVYM